MGFFKKLFGTTSEKEVRALEPIVQKIEALEESYKALTDAELQAKTPEFKERLRNGESLDDILPEAFAVCREADDADFHQMLAQLTSQLRLLAETQNASIRNVL